METETTVFYPNILGFYCDLGTLQATKNIRVLNTFTDINDLIMGEPENAVHTSK